MQRLFLLIIIMAFHAPALAQFPPTSPGWQQVLVDTAPPARYDHALVAVDNGLLLFGGQDGGVLNDTWIFDLTTQTWREVLTANAPSPRFGMGAAYDAERNRVVIFGGQGESIYNDTWAFDLLTETWAALTTSGTLPDIRYGTSGVINPETNQFIVSHGFAAGRYDDTFALDLTTLTWTDISPQVRPFQRCLHDAALDPLTGQMLLFGGCSSPQGPCPQGDFWSYQNGAWTELKAAGDLPVARYKTALVMDEQSRVWLFGGNTSSGFGGDFWQYDLNSGLWMQVESDTVPSARASHEAVWHKGQIILFGGQDQSGALNDLWIYTPPTLE